MNLNESILIKDKSKEEMMILREESWQYTLKSRVEAAVCVIDVCFKIIKLRNVQKVDHRMRKEENNHLNASEPHSEWDWINVQFPMNL